MQLSFWKKSLYCRIVQTVLCLSAAALILCAGCRSEVPPPEPPWTPSKLENAMGGPDPIEKFNRCMFAVTDFGMNYFVDPLGRVYTSIFPRPFIEKFHNVCVNLEYPGRCFSCLGRGEWEGARDETYRFFINLTLGFAGFFDVAKDNFGIYDTGSDFGQTFAAWGFGPGCTLILPFSRHINVRDNIGQILDIAFDLKTYIPFAGMSTALNRMVIAHRAYVQVVENSSDPYKMFRLMVLTQRELEMRMWFYRTFKKMKAAAVEQAKLRAEGKEIKKEPPADRVPERPPWMKGMWVPLHRYYPIDPVVDSLRNIRFAVQQDDDYWYFRLSVFNQDFAKMRKDYATPILPGMPKLEYCFWHAPEPQETSPDTPKPPERLVIILTGIGGYASANSPTALAEIFNKRGFSAVTMDCPFDWKYMRAMGNHNFPGYLPLDGAHMRLALTAVLKQLREKGEIKNPEITLTGYSFGGLHTLKVAELETHDPTLGIKRYVAINPPVDLKNAIASADSLAAAGNVWTRQTIVDKAVNAVGTQLLTLAKRLPHFDPKKVLAADQPDYSIQVEKQLAYTAAGLFLRLPLQSLLLTAAKERDIGLKTPYSWWKRNKLYEEIDGYTFKRYAEELLAKEHPEFSIAELYAQSGVRSMEATLAKHPDIRILHNVDDFLLSEQDKRYLDNVYHDRLFWFSNGGHLGNLYTVAFQIVLLNSCAITPFPLEEE